MSQTLTSADVSHYYQRLAELSTLPFWQLPEITEPTGPERGHVWHWHEVYPELARSRDILDGAAAATQRRALIFRNPGLAPPAVGATPTIAAAYQMLFPGETAPVHAHSMSALRFGLAGRGARMIIDGDRVPMEPGDLILTPGWCWHGHVHPGSDEPVVWMDGLDVPFVMGLRAGFFRDDPYQEPLPTRDATGAAVSPATLGPPDDRAGRHSPVRRYPWQEAYPALQRVMAQSSQHNPLSRLEYRNPITGGPVLATLACLLEGLPAGARSRVTRETASSVIVVARGTGTLVCGGQTFALLPHDVAAIPAWTWHQLAARDHELVVFRVTDRPLHDAFGLFRAEETDTVPPVDATSHVVGPGCD